MRPTLKRLSILCSSAMLLACADLNTRAPLSLGAADISSADAAYLQGRQQHLAQRHDEAIKAYRAALAADERHVNARNGLAALYAEKGDYAQAIPLWRALTEKATMSSGPGAAFLFNNLGYAYLLSGDYNNAQAALEKACLLDPLNYRAWQRLGLALQKLGQDERAEQMLRQAAALRQHDFRADYAAVGGSGSVAIDTAVKTTPRPDPKWAVLDLRVAPNGMLELKRTSAAASVAATAGADAGAAGSALAPAGSATASALATPAQPQPLPVAPQPAAPGPLPAPALTAAPRIALLEIRNGNGVTGMARALSHQMGDGELKVVRLTNDKGFNVRTTRVEYQPAYREAAERLAERFGSARAVQVDDAMASHLRLVIGHDLRGKFALRPVVRPPQAPALAQLAQP
ncbi:MAG TPA: tetratricopeptide repeat protein [Telluria sp.]